MTQTELATAVAKLLACDEATDSDFMFLVADELHKLGYNLEAHQRGIQGTHLIITKE